MFFFPQNALDVLPSTVGKTEINLPIILSIIFNPLCRKSEVSIWRKSPHPIGVLDTARYHPQVTLPPRTLTALSYISSPHFGPRPGVDQVQCNTFVHSSQMTFFFEPYCNLWVVNLYLIRRLVDMDTCLIYTADLRLYRVFWYSLHYLSVELFVQCFHLV